MSITDEEKQAYCSFADALNRSIYNYQKNHSFNLDYNSIIDKLTDLISNNIFEENICNVSDLISVFVNGDYNYYEKVDISVGVVANFMELLQKSTASKRKLIVSNLIHKISQKPIEYDDEYPF